MLTERGDAGSRRRVVVIGGVACGPKAAARLRRLDPDIEITIVEMGAILSYAGCGLPYVVSGETPYEELNLTPSGIPRDAAFFRAVKGITVLDRTLAESIDRKARTVTTVHLDNGTRRTLPYDQLVLATGGEPVVPPIEGIDLAGVFRLYRPEDARAILDTLAVHTPRRAVVIGAGLIGMEATEALARRGLDVTVVELQPSILPGVLDPEMAGLLERDVREQGVTVLTGQGVGRIEGDALGQARAVATSTGVVPADLVVVSVGVRPNTGLAAAAGLEVSRAGIVVDARLRTSDPDIYAGGDCVANRHLLTGQLVFAPMGSTANRHGRVIGDNLAGRPSTFPGMLGTAVVKVFDDNVGKTGLTEAQARAAGYETLATIVPAADRAHYYPGSERIFTRLIADATTERVLGAQVLGPGDAVKRVDVVATALTAGFTLEQLSLLDLGYAPPYNTAIDPVEHTANVLRNVRDGTVSLLRPPALQAALAAGEGVIVLDVRTAEEFEEEHIDACQVVPLPLTELAARAGELPRDRQIAVVCGVGVRAYDAQRLLTGLGFPRVHVLEGGMAAWPYATTGAAGVARTTAATEAAA